MNLLCKFYSNQVRLANSVQYLSEQASFRFFCVSGMLVRNKKGFEVMTDTVTVVVSCVLPNAGRSSMMLMTSDPALREKDNQMVNTAELEYDSVYYNLCLLLQEKFKASRNPVTIEFRDGKMLIAITISSEEEGELQCTAHGSEGDLVVRGAQNIRDMLKQCTVIHSFKYTTETAECKREVSVCKGRADILREISRYLNRTLVLVSFMSDGDMLEQYVSTSGILEVVSRENGKRFYQKIMDNKLRDSSPFFVYQSVSTIDAIRREQGKALHSDKRG